MGLNWATIATGSQGNCYTLDNGQSRLLVEAGVPVRMIQEKIGFVVSSLAGCLVSHGHGDHCKGIREILRAGVTVYATAETFIGAGVGISHRCCVVQPRGQFRVAGGWGVKTFETVHDIPGSLGFIIASGSNKLLFITDTAYIRFKVPGLTHVVIEANFSEKIVAERVAKGELHPARAERLRLSHMSIERALDLLAANDLSQVEWIRLVHLSNENSDEAMFKDMVEKATGIPVYVE